MLFYKKLNEIEFGQKEKRRFTTTIPFDKGTSIKLKKEAAKYGICVPIKPNPSVFQRLRSDKVEIGETVGIYKLKFINENNERGCYIGKTKRKIKKKCYRA